MSKEIEAKEEEIIAEGNLEIEDPVEKKDDIEIQENLLQYYNLLQIDSSNRKAVDVVNVKINNWNKTINMYGLNIQLLALSPLEYFDVKDSLDFLLLQSSFLDKIIHIQQNALSNTGIYRIKADVVYDTLLPNKKSMVRGEPLLELLQLIVNFLVTHDHPYPMLPPTQISAASGISTADILKKMREAYQKVLNSNIRIN